ncbi:MAG: CDP-glycerol glycerophosphotransferase family protein [Ornithinibacter sp.]
MAPTPLSRPLRHLSLSHTDTGLTVSVAVAAPLMLRRAFVKLRRATGEILWSVDLDGGEVEFVIPPAALLDAFEGFWPGHVADAALSRATDERVRPLLADLGFVIESDRELGAVRAGTHEYVALSPSTSLMDASRPLPAANGSMTVYLRKGGGISMAFGTSAPVPRTRGSILFVRRDRTSWELTGEVESESFALTGGSLVLVPRRSGGRIVLPTTVLRVDRPDAVLGRRRLRFSAVLDQAQLLGRFERPEFIDAYFTAQVWPYAEPLDVRVRRLAPRGRLIMPASVFSDGTRAGELHAYRTFKAGSLAFEFRPLDVDAVGPARTPWRSGKLLRWQTRHRPVWLVGERPETAQDTGVALFEYLREAHPEIDARYVITRDSPDLARVADDPNTVMLGSRRHVESALAARRILGSHHSEYLLPVRGPRFERNVKATRVFLQHGVMGTKNMVPNYGYAAPGFTADAFIVSSDRERRMIEDDFGWPSDRVFVTGLARHDRLFAANPPPQRRILVMPTWRDWLRNGDDVGASEFRARWQGLLHSSEFRDFLTANDLVADLYLHANMQLYAGLFDLTHVNVVRHGEIAIQDLLLRSMALVTDYTSAAIDFAFLDRPVFYYQFDRTRFLGKRPSHFDLDEELPGEIVATPTELMRALSAAADRGFSIHPDARRKASALIAHRDTSARERIVTAAVNAPRRRIDPPRLRDAMATARRLRARLRRRPLVVAVRERVSTPTRTGLYALARTLPRSGLVAFESNLGADYGDSPGAIHRAIRARGLDVRIGWVARNRAPVPEGSVRLDRLGWRYVWQMGRASVWVSNQNMPSWMRRPDDTFYLQTWHGTPLKRMLHDLDTVVGRDTGYVDRVDRMIGEWSLLLAPSPWAAERLRSAFRYRGEMLDVGYPRNDALADGSTAQRAEGIRKRLGLAASKKVLLYAPTFRDDQRSGKVFTFSLPVDMAGLAAAVGDQYEIVVRLHPIIRGKVRLPWGVHDAGAGFAMEDLLATADVLVTDYSSVMFDYAVLERPMIFFVPDLEKYRDTMRGFYFDFEASAPGPLVRTTAELVTALNDGSAAKYADVVREFRERFCPYDDGAAGERVLDDLVRRGVLPGA